MAGLRKTAMEGLEEKLQQAAKVNRNALKRIGELTDEVAKLEEDNARLRYQYTLMLNGYTPDGIIHLEPIDDEFIERASGEADSEGGNG